MARITVAGPRRVALIVETSLVSGRDILEGVARYMREHEAWAIFHQPRALEEGPPRWLRQWRGDGVIARLQSRAIGDAVVRTRLPAVDVLGVAARAGVPLVHVDGAAIARLAADHLMERGLRHFGYFDIAGESWSTRRRDAFARCLDGHGHDCEVYAMKRRPRWRPPWETGDAKLVEWLVGLPKPAGVMVCTDEFGPMVLEAARQAGARVPDDVAVIGVGDDAVLCDLANPPMTSVRPDHEAVGYAAAALLDRMMYGEPPPSDDEPTFIAPIGVRTRRSTDMLAIGDEHVAAALGFIREHATEGIGVDDVVATVPVSRSVLQRRFVAAIGRTVNDQIVRARVDRARELLTGTDLPLEVIAERAGFTHREYLTVVFKRELRTTPAAYRREHRG